MRFLAGNLLAAITLMSLATINVAQAQETTKEPAKESNNTPVDVQAKDAKKASPKGARKASAKGARKAPAKGVKKAQARKGAKKPPTKQAAKKLGAEPWKLKATVFADRAANDDGDDQPGSIVRLQPRLGGGLEASRVYNLESGHIINLALGPSLEVYPENDDANRYFFDAEAMYIVPLMQGMLRQFRIGPRFTYAHNDENWVYGRGRVEAALRFQPAPRNTVQLRTRVGYREQNDEDTFVGYDQGEYLFDMTHNWRSQDSVWKYTSMIYYEHREAESDSYTYDEGGVRLIGRYKFSPVTDLVGRTNAFVRNYADGIREDQRLRGTLGVDWDLGDETIVGVFGGYQRNWSTVPEKDYGGGVFGVQMTRNF